MSELTIKQENFCLYHVETGNASEAYRRAYDIRVSDLLDKLEDIYQESMKKGNFSVAVSSVMGQAKILGFDRQAVTSQEDLNKLPRVINVHFSDEPGDDIKFN